VKDQAKLYGTLLEMLHAAETSSKEQVVALNKEFIPEYNRIMPKHYEKDSLPDLYDRARNKLIDSVDDLIAPSSEEKREELQEAKTIISRIPKPKH
jgi:hypothetical protein